jgi:hypothetical protein
MCHDIDSCFEADSEIWFSRVKVDSSGERGLNPAPNGLPLTDLYLYELWNGRYDGLNCTCGSSTFCDSTWFLCDKLS